jgi:hypothetical protein
LFVRAQGVVVVGSSGPDLWRRFLEHQHEDATRWDYPDPLDAFVASLLDRADIAMQCEGIGFRRFEPTLSFRPAVNFPALGEIVGLGSMGPFGMLVHERHGAWWALRGAWLVDAEVDPRLSHAPPCAGCPAPCVSGAAEGSIATATPEVRGRCVRGGASRYDDDQIGYHYDRAAIVPRLRGA